MGVPFGDVDRARRCGGVAGIGTSSLCSGSGDGIRVWIVSDGLGEVGITSV